MARTAKTAQASTETTTWKAKLLAEKQIGARNWKVQQLTSPEGQKFLSLKAFGVKQDGTEYQTKQGITLLQEDCDSTTFVELAGLLKVMHNTVSKKKLK